MGLKLELEISDPHSFWSKLFGVEKPRGGEVAKISCGAEIVNINGGSRGISTSDLVTFAADNSGNVAASLFAAAIYDAVKSLCRRIVANGMVVHSATDIEKQLGKE